MGNLRVNNTIIKANGMTLDSRAVQAGYVFCAIPAFGASQARPDNANSKSSDKSAVNPVPPGHGIAYAGDAIKRGATHILWEPTDFLRHMPDFCEQQKHNQPIRIPLTVFPHLHQHLSALADDFFEHPSRDMHISAVTGTNGKTSVSHYIAALQQANNQSSAVIGTLGNGRPGHLQSSRHTTPDAIQTQQLLAQFRDQHIQSVAMEVSSHALDQFRVAAVSFHIAIMTNISRDHLDYHGDMSRYAACKQQLLEYPGLRGAVLNMDDSCIKPWAPRYQDKLDIIQYALDAAHLYPSTQGLKALWAENIQMRVDGMQAVLRYDDPCHPQTRQSAPINLSLLGRFNLSNVLAAIASLLLQGYPLSQLAAQAAELMPVSGRLQALAPVVGMPLCVIDYAHTPDALENVLLALREHGANRLWCVFGCGGDRDRGKRPLMAKVAARNADQLIITSDNPRSENPESIIRDIIAGLPASCAYQQQIDRTEAIRLALRQADAKDVVLIAGKGHEDYQEINGTRYPFSDQSVCEHILREHAG